jgi:hypothetical protein
MKKRPKKVKVEAASKPVVFHEIPYGKPASELTSLPRGQYWLRQTGDTSQNKKLGSTTLDEQFDLGGFKFDDAPSRWELVKAELEVTSCLRLLREFRIEARWWRKPAAWVRNPERNGMPVYGDEDVIIAFYGRNFHITIERYGRELFGPHPCRLYYRSRQVKGEFAWVGIAQINAMWFSDEKLLAALNHEIKNKRFWQSDKTATTIVLK